MTRVFIAAVFMFVSWQAHAETDFVEKCLKAALPDLRTKAEALGAKLLEHTVHVDSIDDRWYNPSKYVWYQGTAEKPDGSRIKIKDMRQVGFSEANACKKPPQVMVPKSFELIEECKPVAVGRLTELLKSEDAKIDVASVAVDEKDEQDWNSNKYAWFRADGKTKDGKTIRKTILMQKSFSPLKPCAQKQEPNEAKQPEPAGNQSGAG